MGASANLVLPIIFMILLNGVASSDIEVFVNDSVSMRCSPNELTDIQWKHNSLLNNVYAGGKLRPPYNRKFLVKKDETTGAYDLIIPNVTLEDAGLYYCSDELSGRRINSTQLTVLYMKPVCTSSMPTDGFVGPNTCKIQQESMTFSCDIVFNGRPPHLSWRSANDSQVFNSSSCEVKSNRSSCSLTLRADPSYDGLVFRCDVGKTKLDDQRYSCNTEAIKVQYFFGDYTYEKKYVHETASCEVRSNLNVRYNWTLKENNEEIFLTSKQTVSIKKPGIHRCEVKYSIRNVSCSTLVSVVNATVLIARTEAQREQSNTLLAVTLPIALVVSVIALIGSTIYIMKLKRQVNLNISSSEMEMRVIVNNCDYLPDDRLNMEGQVQRLKELIESEFGLLDQLLSCGALTNAIKETIENKSTFFEKNELLLNYIFSQNKHHDLMQALSDCGQHHVVNWVRGNGEYKNEYGFDWPLREAEENVLDNNHQALVDLLDVDGILPKLYDRGMIDDRQRESIDSKPTEHERSEALLDAMRRFSRKSYFIFKECLRESGQSHVADILDKGAIIVPVHATLECENLDEVETQIVNQMAQLADDLMTNASVEKRQRLIAALQLKVVAFRRGQSIVSYISCIEEEDFIHLCKIIENFEMRNILEQLFNLLIANVNIKVVLVTISSEDNARAQKAFEDMKSSWTIKISDLYLELIDIILEKSYLLSILRQKESSQNPKDEVVIKKLASVDFCWFQRITKKRFKNVVWSMMKKHYEDKCELYLIYKSNQQFLEEIHQISGKTRMALSTVHLSNSESVSLKGKRSSKKRQTENQMLRTAFLAPENEDNIFEDFLRSCHPKEQEFIGEIMHTGGGAARVELKMSRPLTEFELIPQQFEDGMEILRSFADRDAVVWIWCHSNNSLQKLNNRDGLKKLIEIVHQSVKATSDVLEHITNIDYDHLKKKLVTPADLHRAVKEYLEVKHDEDRLCTIRAILARRNFHAKVNKTLKENLFEVVCEIEPPKDANEYLQIDRLLDIFIINGIDLNDRNKNGETFLMLACKNGRIDIVHSLLRLAPSEFVLNIDAVDSSGETALMKAKHNYYTKCFAALLGKKLISAVEDEKEDTVRSILDDFNNASDIFVKSWISNQDHDFLNTEKENKFGIWSGALHMALKADAKSRNWHSCYEKPNKYGIWKEAMYMAMEKTRKRSEEILKLLLDCDILLSVEAEIGCPLLHQLTRNYFAYGGKKWRLITLLLESGNINVNATDPDGKTVLHNCDDETLALLLIRYGANVNKKDNEGETPSDYFDIDEAPKIWEEAWLLIDLNAVDSNGRTVLMKQVIGQDSDYVELLLNAGASVNLSDHLGFTALHHALYGNNEEYFEIPRNSEELKERKDMFAILFSAEENTHNRFYFLWRNKVFNEERMKTIEMLLQRPDIDVNVLSFEKFSPLDLAEAAIPEIPLAIKDALKEKGAVLNVFMETGSQSKRRFHFDVRCKFALQRFVRQANDYKDFDLLKMKFQALIEAHKEQIVSGKDQKGRTALHLTAISFRDFVPDRGCIRDLANTIVKELVTIGCNVNETDIYGNTPLHYADFSLKDVFRHYGADESIKDRNSNRTIDETPPQSSTSMFDIVSTVIDRNEDRYFLRLVNNKHMAIIVQCSESQDRTSDDRDNFREFWRDFKNVFSLFWEEGEYAFRHPLVKQITKEVRELMSAVAKDIERLDPRFEIRPEFIGSSNEGTKLEKPDEFDFCFVLTKFSELCEVSLSPELPTGFVRLKRKSIKAYETSDFDSFFGKDGILNTEKLNSHFTTILRNALVNIENQQSLDWNLAMQFKIFYDAIQKTSRIDMMNHLNFSSVGKISIDIVPCIHIDGWWPHEAIFNVSDDIKMFGCNLIFDRPQNEFYPWVPYSESCARILFSKAESDMIKQSCDNAREAYMIGKTMIKEYRLDSEYTLKNCMLYCIEALTPTSEKASQLGLGLEELESKFYEIDRHVWLKCLLKCHLEFVSQDFCPCYFLPNFSSPVDYGHLKSNFLSWMKGNESKFPSKCKKAYVLYRCTSDETSSESCNQLPAPDPLWEHFDRSQLIAILCEIAYKQF